MRLRWLCAPECAPVPPIRRPDAVLLQLAAFLSTYSSQLVDTGSSGARYGTETSVISPHATYTSDSAADLWTLMA
jgi:hypothetical protein